MITKISILVALFFIMTEIVSLAATSGNETGRFDLMRQFYTSLSQFQLHSKHSVTMPGKDARPFGSSYSSWFDGSNYRIDVAGDEQADPMINYNIAYNGSMTQILRNTDGYFTYTASPKKEPQYFINAIKRTGQIRAAQRLGGCKDTRGDYSALQHWILCD